MLVQSLSPCSPASCRPSRPRCWIGHEEEGLSARKMDPFRLSGLVLGSRVNWMMPLPEADPLAAHQPRIDASGSASGSGIIQFTLDPNTNPDSRTGCTFLAESPSSSCPLTQRV